MRYKLFITFLIFLVSLYLILPNFIKSDWLSKEKISLGLDLRGGSSLLLKVDFQKYLKEKLDIIMMEYTSTLQDKKINFFNIKNNQDHISFKSSEAFNKIKKITEEAFSDMSLSIDKDNTFTLQFSSLTKIKDDILFESISSVQRRVDESGTREAIIQPQGDDRILLQVPGLNDPMQLKSLLGKTAKLSFHLLTDKKSAMILKDKAGRKYPVRRRVELSGDSLSHASVSLNRLGSPAVNFKFNTTGAKKFAKITKENVNKAFAIVLDQEVLTAPIIREPIMAGKGEISGKFTLEEAKELAILLRSGALPAPLDIIEERTVGPSLGEDALSAGIIASVTSIIVISAFMIIIYGLFGVCAAIALIMNLIIILACLTIIGATLTLPGIAGLVLTIGMAVDANVLIFERIKEEYNKSQIFKRSIVQGFKNAMTTILDSNITTLIAAFLMFCIGAGPVKGFAVTLSIGILSSMFSAIVITRQMIYLLVKKIK